MIAWRNFLFSPRALSNSLRSEAGPVGTMPGIVFFSVMLLYATLPVLVARRYSARTRSSNLMSTPNTPMISFCSSADRRRHRDAERSGDLRGIEVGNEAPAVLHGVDEPRTVGEIVAQPGMLELRLVLDLGDVLRDLVPVPVYHVGELDEGVLFEKLLDDHLLHGMVHGPHFLPLHHAFHEMQGDLLRLLFELVQVRNEVFGQVFLRLLQKFVMRDAGGPALFVLLQHPFVHLGQAGVTFVDLLFRIEVEMAVHPVGDARDAGLVGDDDAHGPLQDLRGVEDVVDLLVLHHAVGMDAGARGVELGADKGVVGRDGESQFPAEVLGHLRDRRRCRCPRRCRSG